MTRHPRTSDKAAHNRVAAARHAAGPRRFVPSVEAVAVAVVMEKRGWLDRIRDWLRPFYGTFGVDIARL